MRRLQQTRRALGSAAYLTLVLTRETQAGPVFCTLWRQIEEFEQRFSRFRADSELSRFNAAAGTKRTVGVEFRGLLLAARTMAEQSSGLYNPFVLPALQRAGYKGSWPTPQRLQEAPDYTERGEADWHNLAIGTTWAHIPANTALDFGGIGKGYLLDQLAETLQDKDIVSYWMSLGGDIICSGHDEMGGPWQVGIQDAQDETKTIVSVSNHDARLAIATSGTTKRRGVSAGSLWHHIIDPHTGKPARTDTLTATVCASSAALADVAAKCLVIAGSTAAKNIMHIMSIENALLQTTDGVTKLGSVWS